MHRKKYIMIIYSMSWIVAEKRYLAQLKQANSAAKEQIKKMDIRELMQLQKAMVPLGVRLAYINEYYSMARQAYKKQYLDYRDELTRFANLLSKMSTRVDKKHMEKIRMGSEDAPVFKARFDEADLAEMIVDALRLRANWDSIEQGQQLNSPALKKIQRRWCREVGFHYVSLHQQQLNHKATMVKIKPEFDKHETRNRRSLLDVDGRVFHQVDAKF